MTHSAIARQRKPVTKPETLLMHCRLDGEAYEAQQMQQQSDIRTVGADYRSFRGRKEEI